jgi:MFS family permease
VRTYRELFHTPEFTPFLLSLVCQSAATALSGLTLATLVFDQTGSPILAALAMFGPALAQLAGASLLLSAADRLKPRAAIVATATVFACGSAVQAIEGIPVAATFAVLFVQGALGSLGAGVRLGLLLEFLPDGGFVLARSVTSMAASIFQVLGYAGGAALVLALGPQTTLLMSAVLFLTSAAAGLRLSARESRASGQPSAGETWRVNRILLSSPQRWPVYVMLWVPNGLVVGAESLFVTAYPRSAGILLGLAAAGTFVGSVLVGRVASPRARDRLAGPLRILLAAPYLGFAFHPSVQLAGLLVVIASIGFAASLPLQEQLGHHTPTHLTGQSFGLASSGVLAAQGLGAATAGAIATWSSPQTAITTVATASLAVTLLLGPALRRSHSRRPNLGATPTMQ